MSACGAYLFNSGALDKLCILLKLHVFGYVVDKKGIAFIGMVFP